MRQIENGLKDKSWVQGPMVPCLSIIKRKKNYLH